jgi:hypothetical protein
MRAKIAKNISVDAGLIMITDPSFYKKWDGTISDDKYLYKTYKVKNGDYKVHWSIKNTWNGPVEGDGILKITSGIMMVSDPCYHFHEHNGKDVWMDLLNATNYLNDEQDGCVTLDKMGGDGGYDVRIEMEEIQT